MNTISRRSIGIIEIVTAGIGFGFIGVFGKQAFEGGLTPGELLSLRFLIAVDVRSQPARAWASWVTLFSLAVSMPRWKSSRPP